MCRPPNEKRKRRQKAFVRKKAPFTSTLSKEKVEESLRPGKRAVAPRSGYFQGLVFIHPPLREGHRPRAQRDALTLTVWAPGRVTLTLANAADHENEQSGGRCAPHHWILWTMIVVSVARLPHSISGTTYRAPRL